MSIALLMLGLLPMLFMFDFSPEPDDPEPETDDVTPSGTATGDLVTQPEDTGAVADSTVVSGLTTAAIPLEPITDDEDPTGADPYDPGTVLQPVTDDEEPAEPDPVDPDSVLQPVTDPGDDAPAPGDASMLQSLLGSETAFDAGAGWLGDYGPETEDIALGTAETLALADDGVAGTGLGALWGFEGTPVVTADDPVQVIAGGDAANTITLGDGAAYAFGGKGDDTITAGEGAAALFGGEGDDTLAASDTAGWIDGGTGDDRLTGGAGDDLLFGGAHAEGDDAVQDDDTIFGGAGDDTILGGYGADSLFGGDGDDVIDNLGRVEQSWSSTTANDVSWHVDAAADTLDGGDGNDTLIMDRADSATGGTGADTFWVYADDAASPGAAEIADFTVGEDFLRITLDPALGAGEPALAVDASGDGQDAEVRVNGTLVAVLRGAPGATASDVMVEIGETFAV